MRYLKFVDETTGRVCIGTSGCVGTEITEDEYNALLAEIRGKVALVDALYNGEITLNDVPEAWQEEIQRRVNERIANQGIIDEQNISAEEALSVILGNEAT